MSSTRIVKVSIGEFMNNPALSDIRQASVIFTYSDPKRMNGKGFMTLQEIEEQEYETIYDLDLNSKQNLEKERARLRQLASKSASAAAADNTSLQDSINDPSGELNADSAQADEISHVVFREFDNQGQAPVTIHFKNGDQSDDNAQFSAEDILNVYGRYLTQPQKEELQSQLRVHPSRPSSVISPSGRSPTASHTPPSARHPSTSASSSSSRPQPNKGNPVVSVSFSIMDVPITAAIPITLTRQDGVSDPTTRTLHQIREAYLSILTVSQANQLEAALAKKEQNHETVLNKIEELKSKYFDIPMYTIPQRSCCTLFLPSQPTFKQYLKNIAKTDPGKALQIVTLLKNEKNRPEGEVRGELQKILGKHRGFIRQWLQDKTGWSWGETTGTKLYNKLAPR